MRTHWSSFDLDGELVFNRFLGNGRDLDLLQELLVQAAPRWSSRLRVWRSARDQIPVDPSDPGALASALFGATGERGATYQAMVDTYGPGPFERFSGSVELRGAGPELTVIVSLDEWVVAPMGSKKMLNNDITVQVRRPKIEGKAGAAWLRETLQTWCDVLSPAWAAGQHVGEYWAKVMSGDPSVYAVGRDFGSHLPGLFWLNFFGRPYQRILGQERLRTAPGSEVIAVDDGVMVVLGDDPQQWDTPDYAAMERQVRGYLGPELFFSKSDPERIGIVPDWEE